MTSNYVNITCLSDGSIIVFSIMLFVINVLLNQVALFVLKVYQTSEYYDFRRQIQTYKNNKTVQD